MINVLDRLCTDSELVRNVWDRYDAQEQHNHFEATVIREACSTRPEFPGVGLGVQAEATSSAAAAVDMVGRVASATVSGVAGIIGVRGLA